MLAGSPWSIFSQFVLCNWLAWDVSYFHHSLLHSQIGLAIWNFFFQPMSSPTKSLLLFLSVLRSYDMLLVRVNLSVFAITQWPKVTYGRSLLWLAFQRDKSLPWQQAAGMAAGVGSWELLSSAASRKREVGLAHIVSELCPVMYFLHQHCTTFPKQCHPLETKCSNICAYGGPFSSKTPHVARRLLVGSQLLSSSDPK